MASGPGSSMQKLSACRKRCSCDPSPLIDEHAMHQRDLAGRSAEGEHADLRPDGERLAEGGLGDVSIELMAAHSLASAHVERGTAAAESVRRSRLVESAGRVLRQGPGDGRRAMVSAQLIQVAVFLAAAAIAAPLGRLLRMGAVLGYLAAGIVIGPYVLGPLYALNDVEQVLHFGEFGVVMLLFVIGLELRPVRLWAMRSAIFGLGTAQLVATSLVLAAIGLALGLAAGPSAVHRPCAVAVLDRLRAAGARGEGRAHHAPRQARLLGAAVPGPCGDPADRAGAALRASAAPSRPWT